MRPIRPWLAVSLALSLPAFSAPPPLVIPVSALGNPPHVDGDLKDWGQEGWISVTVRPAVEPQDREKLGLAAEDRNQTGWATAKVKAAVSGDRFYFAVRWPDESADIEYGGWELRGNRYFDQRRREDMFAVRFHMEGDFDRSMLSNKTYTVDTWLWSAARTNPAGLAEDMTQTVSAKSIEQAAEYEMQGIGTVYIKKVRDRGNPIYRIIRPPSTAGVPRSPSFELTGKASGSMADVAAKGVWKAKHWHLEFSRKLDTGNTDDVVFKPGQKLLGQIAIFNRGYDEHKSVSEPLYFDFTAIK